MGFPLVQIGQNWQISKYQIKNSNIVEAELPISDVDRREGTGKKFLLAFVYYRKYHRGSFIGF